MDEGYYTWRDDLQRDHNDIIEELREFAEKHCADEAWQQSFCHIALSCCYAAKKYDISSRKLMIENDRQYNDELESAMKSIENVVRFIERHSKKNTQRLNGSMTVFALMIKEEGIVLHSAEGRQTVADITIKTLSTLKSAIETDGRFKSSLHRRKHGCILYPEPTDRSRQATVPRMLALNLCSLFRHYSAGNVHIMRQQGWHIPSDPRYGSPNHDLVTRMVEIIFPDENRKLDARSAEADFIKNTPGARIVSWE